MPKFDYNSEWTSCEQSIAEARQEFNRRVRDDIDPTDFSDEVLSLSHRAARAETLPVDLRRSPELS